MSGSFRRDVASGLVVLVPLLVTVYVLRWLYKRIARVPLIGSLAPELPVVGTYAPNLSGVLFTIAVLCGLVMAIGYLMRTALGVVVVERIDEFANRMPGFRMVYNASQVAVESAVSDSVELSKPTKVDLWNGTRLTAFRTGQSSPDGRAIVFVPTSPNVTSGFVVEVSEDALQEVDESLEDALTRVISAGFGEGRERTREEIQAIPTPDELEDVGRRQQAAAPRTEPAETELREARPTREPSEATDPDPGDDPQPDDAEPSSDDAHAGPSNRE